MGVPSTLRRIPPLWLRAAMYAVGYFAAAELGNALSIQSTFSTIWPAAGVALAVLLLTGRSEWPVMLLAGMLGNIASDLNHDRVLTMALLFALANASEALLAATIIRAFSTGDLTNPGMRQVLLLVGGGVLAGPVLGASLGTLAVLAGTGTRDWSHVWLTWWVGDALGVAIVTPLILLGVERWRHRRTTAEPPRTSTARAIEGFVLALLLCADAWFVFDASAGGDAWKYTLIPLIVWAGIRFGVPGCAIASAFVTAVGVVRLHGTVPLSTLAPVQTAEHLLQFQLFLVIASMTCMLLAALVQENRRNADLARVAAEKYRVIFEELPVAVTICDSDGVVAEASREAQTLLGIRADGSEYEGPGAGFAAVHTDGSNFRVDEFPSLRTLAHGEGSRVEDMGIITGPTVRWLDATSVPLRIEGYGAATAYADVTERRRALLELEEHRDHLEELVRDRTEELERMNRELLDAMSVKDRFMQTVSHELRTPLNAIIGFSGVLQNGHTGALEPEQLKQISMIHDAGDRLLTIVNEMLNLSRIDDGQVQVKMTTFDIGEVIAEVVRPYASVAALKGVSLVLDAPLSPVLVRTARKKVVQILMNLVDNAVKFTDEGEVRVEVRVADLHLHIIVSDTGIGIDSEDLGEIMEDFHQIVPANGAKPHGPGLGLPIAGRLVALLGGTIGVSSAPGVGSSFEVEIPLAEEPAPDSPAEGASSAE